jgi:hypothetical protein
MAHWRKRNHVSIRSMNGIPPTPGAYWLDGRPMERETSVFEMPQDWHRQTVSGERDNTPTVESIPNGFKAVQTEYGPDFRCGACDIAVDP